MPSSFIIIYRLQLFTISVSSGAVCTHRTTGHLQHKQDLIYVTDYLHIQNQQPEFKKTANGRRYILKTIDPNFIILLQKN
jgi:hypothetical protein